MPTRPVELTENEYFLLMSLLNRRIQTLTKSGDYPEKRSDLDLMFKLTKEHNKLILLPRQPQKR